MSIHDRDDYRDHYRAPQRRPHLEPSRWRRATGQPRWLLWIGIVLGCFLIAHLLGGLRRQQPFPEPGTVHWYVAETAGPRAPLTLTAPAAGPADFAVRLDQWDSRQPVALVPIRSGASTTFEMPLGRYRMTITKGLMWQGTGKLFHITTDAREVVEPVEFTRVGNTYSGHTIQLETLAGNMDTRPAR